MIASLKLACMMSDPHDAYSKDVFGRDATLTAQVITTGIISAA